PLHVCRVGEFGKCFPLERVEVGETNPGGGFDFLEGQAKGLPGRSQPFADPERCHPHRKFLNKETLSCDITGNFASGTPQGLPEIPVLRMVSYFPEDRCTYPEDGDVRRVVDQ